MADLVAIFDDLRAHTDDVIDVWDRRARDIPWLELPEEARIDHLPDLLDAMVDALVGTGDGDAARKRVLRLAIAHGRHRSQQGFDDGTLHREHHLLRGAVWDVVRERHGADARCFAAIARFDVVLTHVTQASLHGFHLGKGRAPGDPEALAAKLARTDPWPPRP